jgi:hypothetical protein
MLSRRRYPSQLYCRATMRRASCESWIFTEARMTPNYSRAEMVSELAELRRLQFKSMDDATYVGWTPAQLTAQQKRADRISLLQHDLDALDGILERRGAL